MYNLPKLLLTVFSYQTKAFGCVKEALWEQFLLRTKNICFIDSYEKKIHK